MGPYSRWRWPVSQQMAKISQIYVHIWGEMLGAEMHWRSPSVECVFESAYEIKRIK